MLPWRCSAWRQYRVKRKRSYELLCCGKPIKDNSENNGWHKMYIKKFFMTNAIPEIEITDSVLESLIDHFEMIRLCKGRVY